MGNVLETIFVFNDAQGAKVDALHKKLLSTNNDFDNLGKNLTFGKTINDNFTTATKAADTFKTKIDSLKTSTENLKKKSYTPGRPLGFTSSNSPTSTKPAFARTNSSAFDDIETRLGKSKAEFQKLSQTKADKGQFDTIYQGAYAAEKKVNDLTNRIRALKKESSDPANAKFGKFYDEGIRKAESDLSRLELKQKTLSRSASLSRGAGARRGLTEVQRSVLEIADDFAPAGFNKPFNAVAKELIAINALSATSLTLFGAFAVAGLAVYKVTSDIRENAERRLATEEKITSLLNKQRLAAGELSSAFNKQLKDTQFNRELQAYQQNNSIEVITGRKQLVGQLLNLNKDNTVSADQEKIARLREEYIALNNQVNQYNDNLAAISKASPDKAFDQRFEDFKKNQESEKKFNADRAAREYQNLSQKKNVSVSEINNGLRSIYSDGRLSSEQRGNLITQYRKQLEDLIEKTRELKIEFNEFISGANLPDNPFVKVLSDIDSAGSRAQKRFGLLGDEFVKAAEKADRANLTKKLGLLSFQAQSEGLRFNQEARRTASIPENQFASFQRAIESVSKAVEFTSQSGNLNRQIQEARFYSNIYNPNNPKSFAEFNRRGANDDVSDFGVQVKNAIEDIRNLNAVGLQGTGVYGRGAIADRVLSIIPSREDLLKRLDNSATRGDAQFLLNQQYGALSSKRDFEETKFNDFLASQKNLEFNKQFAREQIALLDRSGLDKSENAKQFLNITGPLGNDVDVNLQRRIYQANLDAGAAKISEEKDAREALKALAKTTADISETLNKIITANGLKIDGSTSSSTVEIVDRTEGSVKVLGVSPKPEDMIGGILGF